jgi:hypothetical protein
MTYTFFQRNGSHKVNLPTDAIMRQYVNVNPDTIRVEADGEVVWEG